MVRIPPIDHLLAPNRASLNNNLQEVLCTDRGILLLYLSWIVRDEVAGAY